MTISQSNEKTSLKSKRSLNHNEKSEFMRLSRTDPSEIDADESSCWNYHYSAETASVVLELPRMKILHFLSNEQRLVNIFIQE